jgi:hypothetical protein
MRKSAGRPKRASHYAGGLADPTRGREWSSIKKVACATATVWWQQGHSGFILLPATPSRNESGAEQCGHGAKCAYPMT